MKRTVSAIGLLAVALTAACTRSDPTPRAAPAPAARAEPRSSLPAPLLWEVEGPGGTSHLFGSMHIGIDPDRELHPIVWRRLAGARVLVLEMDVAQMREQKMELMKLARLPPGPTLEEQLGPERWAKLRAQLGEGLPEAALKKLSPWFVTLLLAQKMAGDKGSVDLEVLRRAVARGTAVAHLEDWRHSVELTRQALTVDMLGQQLDDPDRARRNYEELADAYRRADAARLAQLLIDPDMWGDDIGRALELTVYQRNREWIPRIEAELGRGKAFIMVGGGHLVGDKSVITLLRAKGYRIRRVAI